MTGFNPSIENADQLTRAHLSENHFGCSPSVWPAVTAEHGRMNLYPDPEASRIRQAIADFHGVPSDMIAVANGTDELILMTALAFLRNGAAALVSSATFPGYPCAAALAGAPVVTVPLDMYEVPLQALAARCRERESVVFVCNPHNPTGTVASGDGIRDLVDAAGSSGCLPVFDEAYSEFAGAGFASAIPLIRAGKRALVTRTFSKAYGLAGFRIGYAVGLAADIARLRSAHGVLPFAVNRLAQAAAVSALADQAFLADVVGRTTTAKQTFCQHMTRIGVSFIPSHTNFVTIQVERSGEFAARLHRDFAILVRDTAPFGLPGHVRIAVAEPAGSSKLVPAIEQVRDRLLSVGAPSSRRFHRASSGSFAAAEELR